MRISPTSGGLITSVASGVGVTVSSVSGVGGGGEIGEPEANPLEGYEITKATVSIINKDAGKKVSQCIITGAEEGDVVITYY